MQGAELNLLQWASRVCFWVGGEEGELKGGFGGTKLTEPFYSLTQQRWRRDSGQVN